MYVCMKYIHKYIHNMYKLYTYNLFISVIYIVHIYYVYIYLYIYVVYMYGVVVITTVQLHSTKPELRLWTGSNPAHGVPKFRDVEDL